MVDFNEGTKIANKFLGSEKKITMIYNGEVYMIKFPDPIRAKNNDLSYMNNQFSEHIGCRIFNDCGIKTQETVLGTYTDIRGKNKIVVGCKDFTQNGATLHEFSKLANSITAVDRKLKTNIEDVYTVINNDEMIKDKADITAKFWDMFVVDALIGNHDRHLDNWGLLLNNGEYSFAPIYDCGSTLGALLSDDEMGYLLGKEGEFSRLEYNERSTYSMGGKRVFYHEIFKAPPEELKDAIKRTVPKINMERIEGIVLNTEGISDIRKEYLTKALTTRYERILAPALKRITKRERSGIFDRLEEIKHKGDGPDSADVPAGPRKPKDPER
jgi:hypothetical protein